jgi:structure-specific recognition protein 1
LLQLPWCILTFLQLKTLKDDSDISDEEAIGVDRGSADEDEESADEDFQEGSDSDVAEEFDSQHDTSGEGSGDDEVDDEDDMDMDDEEEEEEEEERPKKKAKTGRK